MNDEKVLLHIGDDGEKTTVQINCKNEKDLFSLALVLACIFRYNPELEAGLIAVMKMIDDDKQFKELVNSAVIDISGFEKILKNGKR